MQWGSRQLHGGVDGDVWKYTVQSGYTGRVPQLLLQHSSALRKRAVGLTYAY